MQTLIKLKFSAFCESEEQTKNNIFRTSIKPKQILLYKFLLININIFKDKYCTLHGRIFGTSAGGTEFLPSKVITSVLGVTASQQQ